MGLYMRLRFGRDGGADGGKCRSEVDEREIRAEAMGANSKAGDTEFGWPLRMFSLTNPEGSGRSSVPDLLRRVRPFSTRSVW